jgi:hypothetical protein
MPKFDTEPVTLDLSGPDGNAFVILGCAQSALHEAGAAPADIEGYLAEAAAGDYDNLLNVTRQWPNFEVCG